MSIFDDTLESRYRAIQSRVRAASAKRETPGPVTLIAVSKTQAPERIAELYRLGQRDFGENYVQELVEKAEILGSLGCLDIRWHFIGHLQSNKAKQLVDIVDSVHSVSSAKLGNELAKRWGASGRAGTLPIFVEVNIDDETSKSGVEPSNTPALVAELSGIRELEVQGLMCIPNPEAQTSRSAFEKLRDLELRCRPHSLGQLSMGMTQDFEQAIVEGATHVRIGSALFGKRPA